MQIPAAQKTCPFSGALLIPVQGIQAAGAVNMQPIIPPCMACNCRLWNKEKEECQVMIFLSKDNDRLMNPA
jgi:hypothetical protein